MIRPSRRVLEAVAVCGLLAAAGVLFSRNIDTAPSYDEGVYLASLDALHQSLEKGAVVMRAIAELCVEKGVITVKEMRRKRN